MSRSLSLALLLAVAALTPGAQQLPAFDVASIKPVDPNKPHMVGVHIYPGGRLVISGFAL